MNQNPDIAGGGVGEQVADILDNIPSDNECTGGSNGGRGRRSYRFRRPAPFDIFRQRRPSTVEIEEEGGDEDGDGTSILGIKRTTLSVDGGKSDDEGWVGALDARKDDIYNISCHADGDQPQIDPLSRDYVGIIANYFSVGLMVGGSTSVLYPVLVVKAGVTSSMLAASYATVMVFWSYKVIFGFLSDCFPIFGYKRKPYIAIGWIFCAAVLIALANEGDDVDPRNIVLMLALANLGYVWADVAADGFMVWIAHREPIERRGRIQTLVYMMNKLGQVFVNILILFGFSGPAMNCVGYEPDKDAPCTNNIYVTRRVDAELYRDNPNGWCYERCHQATFDWDLGIPAFAMCICFVIAVSLPLYLRLKEDRVTAEPRVEFLMKFWSQIKRRACWQIILYGMISHVTFGVINAAKFSANYVWLDLHTYQHQIMLIFEKLFFFIGLNLVRRYALNVSWKKLVLVGSCLTFFFNGLYFLIIFDVYRNAWFYIFTDVSALFMYTLNFLASHASMVEVAEPGYEAITYSLITTATNAVSPLSAVVSYQLLAFFPSLNDQESIARDTPQVRNDFARLHLLVILLNMSSLLSLPLLPRQKKETRELVAKGEKSCFWGGYVIVSALTFLSYSTFVTLVTVKYHDVYGCLKVLGGGGCSGEETSTMAFGLVSFILIYCYGTNFYLSYWPIVKGEHKFSWRMFV